jgi:hypothetical protein
MEVFYAIVLSLVRATVLRIRITPSVAYFLFYPVHQNSNDIPLFFLRQLTIHGDVMPFLQATSTTTACGMLSQKDGMPTHRGLLPIIGNMLRSQTLGDEITGMKPDGLQSFLRDILLISLFQMKPTAEG